MNKPKIAVLIDWYLPGTKAGGPVRSVYSLVNLLKDDFEFYIITNNTDLNEQQPYETVTSNTLFEKDGFYYYYFSSDKLSADNLLALLHKIEPQVVYLNSFWSYHFSISLVRLKSGGQLNVPLLLAPRGMLGKGALGLKSFKKHLFITLAKLMGWYKNVSFHATQKQEEADIQDKFGASKIFIASNVNSAGVTNNVCEKKEMHLRLFYLSRVARVKNLHFALEALKSIPANYQVEYHIFGNLEDKEYWAECAKIIDLLPVNVSVRYLRELAFNEVQSQLITYHALLMPTLNENFGHSIVESLLCGCPVIISDQTPWLDVEDHDAGYAISLNNRDAFTEAVVKLCSLNNDQFKEKSKAAIKYISGKINLPVIAGRYKEMFNECIKN